jgi:hypothetical protein
MLALVMAGNGQLTRHLRACRRILRRNATLGANAFSFGELVALWITYWHFASVTRQISGTQFCNVPANRTTTRVESAKVLSKSAATHAPE